MLLARNCAIQMISCEREMADKAEYVVYPDCVRRALAIVWYNTLSCWWIRGKEATVPTSVPMASYASFEIGMGAAVICDTFKLRSSRAS